MNLNETTIIGNAKIYNNYFGLGIPVIDMILEFFQSSGYQGSIFPSTAPKVIQICLVVATQICLFYKLNVSF